MAIGGGRNAREIKYYIVAANALPEIFVKVAEAKRMMQTGEADTVGAATKMVASAAARSTNIRMRCSPSTT